MPRIYNPSAGPIGLDPETIIDEKSYLDVEKDAWAAHLKNPVIKGHLDAGRLTIDEPKAEEPKADDATEAKKQADQILEDAKKAAAAIVKTAEEEAAKIKAGTGQK